MKKKETQRGRVRAELAFVVEVEVADVEDMAEIYRNICGKFRDGIRKHEIAVYPSIVKTEVVV